MSCKSTLTMHGGAWFCAFLVGMFSFSAVSFGGEVILPEPPFKPGDVRTGNQWPPTGEVTYPWPFNRNGTLPKEPPPKPQTGAKDTGTREMPALPQKPGMRCNFGGTAFGLAALGEGIAGWINGTENLLVGDMKKDQVRKNCEVVKQFYIDLANKFIVDAGEPAPGEGSPIPGAPPGRYKPAKGDCDSYEKFTAKCAAIEGNWAVPNIPDLCANGKDYEIALCEMHESGNAP